MPNYDLECNYCGHKWSEFLYTGQVHNLSCKICNDSDIVASLPSDKKGDVFGYNIEEKDVKRK